MHPTMRDFNWRREVRTDNLDPGSAQVEIGYVNYLFTCLIETKEVASYREDYVNFSAYVHMYLFVMQMQFNNSNMT